MTASPLVRSIMAARPKPETARQIIEARMGRRLCPAAVLPPDLRRAILLLGRHIEKARRAAQ